MFRLRSKRKPAAAAPEKGKAVVLPLNGTTPGIDQLSEVLAKIRPSRPRRFSEAEMKFQVMLYQLQQDRSRLFSLRKALLSRFMKTNIVTALTESGIVSNRGFIQELGAKLKHKILPALRRPDDFLYVIDRVFYRRGDHIWVEGIDPELWKRFFVLLGIQINLSEPGLINQLQQALQILSYRIVNLSLEKEVTSQYDSVGTAIQPFLEQNRLVNMLVEKNSPSLADEDRKLILANILEALHNCLQSLEWMREHRREGGTSLSQTFVLFRLQQQVERMFIILDVLDGDSAINIDRFLQYFQTVVRNQNRKNSLGEFLSQNLGVLAYQIAEHKGKRGEQYITSTRRDFASLFLGAMGGGLIISLIAILKNLIGIIKMPLFWQGFLYGSNYAFGFILIDQTGSTLATKQPAYTASAVASSLDARKMGGLPDLNNLAITIARVSRSQIASFAGNLVVVFPLTYILAMLFHRFSGFRIASGDAAMKMLADQHPFQSLSLLYACFTGFFLFLSGLIAGYVENHVVYGRVADRLRSHPLFLATMSKRRLDRIVRIVHKSSGALAGSIALGFFLGIAGPIGKFLGLPFDIRHITISAANTSIAFYGLDHAVPMLYFFTIVLGVLMIGVLNFLVSFSLAFYVALRSRGVKIKEYPELLGLIGRYFKAYPWDFFWPPRRARLPEEIEQFRKKTVT